MENLEQNASEVKNTNNIEENIENVRDNTNDVKNQQKEEKYFTQDDLDKIIAKKFKQWEKKKEVEKHEIEEAEKLKRMSESERQQAEMKKQIEEFNKMKAEMDREKLNNQTVKELASRKLPIGYAEFVMVNGDADATMERLRVFEQNYRADVQREVDRQIKERLRGNAPKGVSNNNDGVEDSSFLKGFRS